MGAKRRTKADVVPTAALERLANKWQTYAEQLEEKAKAMQSRGAQPREIAWATVFDMCVADLRALIAKEGSNE